MARLAQQLDGAAYYSLCFSLPPLSPPTSPTRHHLKAPSRPSLGKKKHSGRSETPAEMTEPAGDRGRRITILSIDGGGVRGIIPATILEELEACLQVHITFIIILFPGLIVDVDVFQLAPIC